MTCTPFPRRHGCRHVRVCALPSCMMAARLTSGRDEAANLYAWRRVLTPGHFLPAWLAFVKSDGPCSCVLGWRVARSGEVWAVPPLRCACVCACSRAGAKILEDYNGLDATAAFYALHSKEAIRQLKNRPSESKESAIEPAPADKGAPCPRYSNVWLSDLVAVHA